MKKKIRRLRTMVSSVKTRKMHTEKDVSEDKKPCANRVKPQKTIDSTTDSSACDNTGTDTGKSDIHKMQRQEKIPDISCKSSGRHSAAVCRLCHGRFSPRSLRHAFNRWPQDSLGYVDELNAASQSPLVFHTDFQHLVGVPVDRDPRLSEFICKKCHTKFYKCRNILIRFLQRVNLPPVGKENLRSRKENENCADFSGTDYTTNPKCLHSLVSWVHYHGEACRSCPDLKEVLEGHCRGAVKAVWGCVDGHSYIMDTQCSSASYQGYMLSSSSRVLGSGIGDSVMLEYEQKEQEEDEEDEEEEPGLKERISDGTMNTLVQQGLPSGTTQTQNSTQEDWMGSSEGQGEAMSPALLLEARTAGSDLSDRGVSEDESEENTEGNPMEEEPPEPYSDKRDRTFNMINKKRQNPKFPEEPRIRKKPGPKPGWKNKFKPKGEELPNIYKCPYQGCTAVYRAPDGLKKHIKEHHEDMRERPCPHPGCNKVFMIDRYLQRHVKLIHTEERNYICDQCGQTFKQRKHLLVHQMRHSGAKPLQCEVCGFQCRQRASLKYHMTKHKAEADLDFECLMCRKRFEKAHNLNVHMSMVHPLTQAEAQRGGGGQAQQQYAHLQTIGLSGELLQQDQDR